MHCWRLGISPYGRELRLKFGSGTALALCRSNGGQQPPAASKNSKGFPMKRLFSLSNLFIATAFAVVIGLSSAASAADWGHHGGHGNYGHSSYGAQHGGYNQGAYGHSTYGHSFYGQGGHGHMGQGYGGYGHQGYGSYGHQNYGGSYGHGYSGGHQHHGSYRPGISIRF